MLIAVLVFLILRQVMPIASGLAGGLALTTFGLVSRTAAMGMRRGDEVMAPAVAYAAPLVSRALGTVMRDTGHSVRAAVARSKNRQ